MRNWLNVLLLSSLWSLPTAALEMTAELRQALTEAVTSGTMIADDWDAQVWFVAKDSRLQRFVGDEQRRLTFLQLIYEEADRADLPTELVLAVIEVESRFDPYAVSRAGAQGLMQVMSFWKDELGRREDNLIDLRTNLRYGCTILAYYLKMEGGELAPALARYNGSYGQSWYSERVLEALAQWR